MIEQEFEIERIEFRVGVWKSSKDKGMDIMAKGVEEMLASQNVSPYLDHNGSAKWKIVDGLADRIEREKSDKENKHAQVYFFALIVLIPIVFLGLARVVS